MGRENENTVFSLQVIEFVAVSKELCGFLENAARFETRDFIIKLHRFLSILYVKALALPGVDRISDDGNEKFVTELDWILVRDNVNEKLGAYDSYLDFFDHMMQETSEPVTCSVSENIADIYQDLKDFISLYQVGIPDVMNDGLYECRQNFEQYWGQRAMASIRRIHHAIFVEGLEHAHSNNQEGARHE